MPDVGAGHWEQIRELLLQPSPENVSRAAACLESLAEEVARVRFSLSATDATDASGIETSRQFLMAARAEAIRARDLLNNAARFYNALNATSDSAGYECHGFLCPVETTRRALARL